MVDVNYLAILVSAVVMIVLGTLWYGPLFGKPWMKIMGFSKESITDEQKKAMGKNYAMMALGSLVMAFVLSHALVFASTYLNTSGVMAGLETGFWNWLGFIAPVTLSSVLWEGRPWKLWFINAGYYLFGLLIIGVLLSVWV